MRKSWSRAGASTADSDDPALEGEAGKIAQLVRRMVRLLGARRGSDIHLEPIFAGGEFYTLVRLRLNGVLHEIRRLPAGLHQPLMLYWKQLAGLNRDERSRPQDGTARLIFSSKTAEPPTATPWPLRVSIVPTIYGEKVAVRVIPTRIPSMADLGIEQTPLKEWIQRHTGLLLFTGPTGSGKFTSMVACLGERICPEVNIMTVEEPIEYLLPGVTQLHIEGFPPSDGLRALLRQDPDIILVGELRGDEQLTQLTIQAAETGHLVLTTMHSSRRETVEPLYQLVEWGVKRSMLANNVVGIVYQELMRKLCEECKRPAAIDDDLLRDVAVAAQAGGYTLPGDATFYAQAGCEACHGTGYGGRFVVMEFFSFTPALKIAFRNGSTQEELRKLAIEGGMITFFAEGVRHAAEGRTSLEDVLKRVPEWR